MEDPNLPIAREIDKVRNIIVATAGRHTLPPALLYAIVHTVSAGDPDAFRLDPPRRDACFGLMQLGRMTVRDLGYLGPVRMLFDTGTNLELGAQYLTKLFGRHLDVRLALIEYSGGPHAVHWWKLHWRRGRAARWTTAVLVLESYYERREKAIASGG